MTNLMKLIAAAAAAWSLCVAAQDYPHKTIRIIVPFATGGDTDVVARVTAQALARVLAQPVIVDNKAGGGGIIGALEIARAVPDGYTLGMATVSTTAANPASNPKAGYDPTTDFTPVISLAATPTVLVVNPSFPAKNYAEMLAEIKKNPGKYSYASGGTGSISHVQMELFKSLTKTWLVHIPYRGNGPALTDAIGGQVQVMHNNLPTVLPYIQSGKLVPIAVASSARLPSMPDVPTFAEVGLAPMNRMAYFGLVGPKGMDKALVNKVREASLKVLADDAVRKSLFGLGCVIVGSTPEEFAEQIKSELTVYRKVISEQNLKMD